MLVSFIGPTSANEPTMGEVLQRLLLGQEHPFTKSVLVSAFADAALMLYLLPSMKKFIKNGGKLSIVIGIDLQSTSQEALQCLLDNNIQTFIFKNRKPGHTFHPKVYYFESDTWCTLIIGSSNLTAGGAFRNYEANLKVDFDLTTEADKDTLNQLKTAIIKYLNPSPPLAQPLTSDYLKQMVASKDVLPEQARKQPRKPTTRQGKGAASPSLYGIESMPSMPKEMIEAIVKANQKVKTKITIPVQVQAFYMTLNKLQGETIPGEARIPLAAIRALPQFWEWPNRYKEIAQQRGKKQRVYQEWKPKWEIIDGQTQQTSIDSVRMYLYKDSMDFRFYSSQLVRMGADEGDLIIIRRSDKPDDVEFQCEWISKNNPRFKQLKSLATQKVRNPKNPNHPRWWGYD